MRKFTKFFALSLSLGLVAGGLVALANSKAQNKNMIETRADSAFVEPNDVFDKIYSDDWNNTTVSEGFNQVLLCFTGTPNGLNNTSIYDNSILNRILINDVPLGGDGSCVIPWGSGQNWFRIAYPVSKVSSGEGCILEIKNGTTIGDSVILGFTLRLNSNLKWEFNSTTSWAGEYVFTDPVNATYSKIYSDDFNNGTHATGYNRLMIVYTGSAHNHSTAITSLLELKRYDGYVQIDGTPLSEYQDGSTQIAPWNGQLWIQLIYPASAVSVGSVLTINEGCKIGDAVFAKMVFRLNSSDKWEKVALIEDDELVKNNDYMLFTPSDLGLSLQNDTIPFYGDLGTTFQDSFAFQFNVNIPSADVATTTSKIYMGSTDNFGTSPMFVLYLNDGTYNFGMFFNGAFDWNTYNKFPSWEGDVTHLVEFYAIKTDSTHMSFLLGVDGALIWKTSADISSANFNGHTFLSFNNSGSTKSKDIYSNAPTAEKALNRFAKNKLASESVAFDNNNDTGACRGENGSYAKAKAFYNNYLNAAQRKAFASEARYEQLRARMVAWGVANGENISFNASTGDLVLNANRISLFKNDESRKVAIISIIAIALGISVTFFFVLKKKQEN